MKEEKNTKRNEGKKKKNCERYAVVKERMGQTEKRERRRGWM